MMNIRIIRRQRPRSRAVAGGTDVMDVTQRLGDEPHAPPGYEAGANAGQTGTGPLRDMASRQLRSAGCG